MNGTEGLPFSEAERQVAQRHPGWHVWHTETLCWATSCQNPAGGSGTTLDAQTPELLDHEIARWEHAHGVAA